MLIAFSFESLILVVVWIRTRVKKSVWDRFLESTHTSHVYKYYRYMFTIYSYVSLHSL